MRNKTNIRATIKLALMVILCNAAISISPAAIDSAQTSVDTMPKNIWGREKVLGDIYGLRSELAKHGISLDLQLSQYYQAVTSGGVNTNDTYGSKLDYFLKVDAGKLGLSKGLRIFMHAETQFGESIMDDAGAFALPNASMLYPLPDYRGTAITGLLFEQMMGENLALAVGKINALDLWTMLYPHTGRGVEGFLNANMLLSTMPWFRWVNLSVMGGGALVLTDDKQIEGGLLVFDSQNSTTTSGFNDMFEEGTALLGLWRFFFDVDNKPGSLLFAGGASTRNYTSLDQTDWAVIPGEGLAAGQKDDTWTAAVYYDQVFWQCPDKDKQNMRLYTGWSVSDGNPNFAKWGGFASVEGWGLVPNRQNDRMGTGAFYNQVSSNMKDLTSTFGIELENVWGTELYYNAEITKSMHLTGDIQLVNNQNQTDSTAVILGLRMVIDF